MPQSLTTQVYVAVRRRREDGQEWVDVETGSRERDWCQSKADRYDAATPTWAKQNPVVRMVRATLIMDATDEGGPQCPRP